MGTTEEQINVWLNSASEYQNLEFKEAKTQFDRQKLAKYCVAIANEGGGLLILGITNEPPRKVVGTRAFNDPINLAQSLWEQLRFRVDIEEVAHPDGRVVVFHIPSRPPGSAYHLEGTYLMRTGEALAPMSEDQLRRIFSENEPEWLEGASVSDLDAGKVIELLDTQAFFELLKLPYPMDRGAVLDRLIMERLVDESAGRYAIKRLGALLLAKRLSDFPELSRKAPRVVAYSGTSKLETRIDQWGSRGYAVGFQGLIDFVVGQLPQNEVIEHALRRDVKLVPSEVIRELVANALIHQEIVVGGASVMVEIYADRIEISNPGEPVVPVDRFIDGYQSRNERLALFMRRFGICEEKGSGVDRVISSVEDYQLPAPEFRVGHRRTSVVIFGPRRFDDMEASDRARACYQHCCLRYVMNEKMTNQSLRERFKLPEFRAETASRIIRDTLDAGKIKPDDAVGASRRYARYVPFWA